MTSSFSVLFVLLITKVTYFLYNFFSTIQKYMKKKNKVILALILKVYLRHNSEKADLSVVS